MKRMNRVFMIHCSAVAVSLLALIQGCGEAKAQSFVGPNLPMINGKTNATNAIDGDLIFDTSDHRFWLRDSSVGGNYWRDMSTAGGAINAYTVEIGDVTNARAVTRTDLLGDVKAVSGTFTFDSSSDVNTGTGVITHASHGLADGDKIYVGTSLNGLTANTTYYVFGVTSSTFKVRECHCHDRDDSHVWLWDPNGLFRRL